MLPQNYDRKHLDAGTVLFRGGEYGDAAYLIETGSVEVYLERDCGETVLARRGPGEIVGEMAMLDGRPRSAAARAITDANLIVITEDAIARRFDAMDPVLKMCVSVVLARYRETVAILQAEAGDRVVAPSSSRRDPQAFAGVIETLVLEREMTGALERGEFELHLQPIVQLADATIAGFEALMRWRHPVRGLLAPSHFIPAAEASGFVSYLTDFALAEVARILPALHDVARDHPAAIAPLPFISVNVSGHDLNRTHFAHGLADTLRSAALPPQSVKLELTESVLMEDPQGAAALLSVFRDRGIGVAIDDFGAGYSSLSYLSSLPITTLKVDRAFVHGMLADDKSRKIVHMIICLAQELGIPVVAEGIEQAAEARALKEMGCALGQGYLFGRPAPVSSTLQLIRGWAEGARSAQAVTRTPERATAARSRA